MREQTMNDPDWKEVLPAAPKGGQLIEAWMTAFDLPDEGLLVEHLLPSLLGMNNSLSLEVKERTLFFGELGTTLESFRDRITILTSPPRGERETSQYPWLWRYVGHFTVGAEKRAVQHAKLWAFLWKFEGADDQLELHISSTNLTESAFKHQVQAGWQVTVPLNTTKQKATWGELVPFLSALAKSAGDTASERLARLIDALDRAKCPDGVTFIVSTPGGKSAAEQLKQFTPSEMHILTPTIGEWNDKTIKAWSDDAGVSPDKLHLKWIAQSHPWAARPGWALTESACKALLANRVKIQRIPAEPWLSEQHRKEDERWSHAKLYLLRKPRQRNFYLLVTSANWSAAAWGCGKTAPRNFELGVVVQTDWSAIKSIDKAFDTSDPPCYVDKSDEDESTSTLEWAEATWSGKAVTLHVRSSSPDTKITASLFFSKAPVEKSVAIMDGVGSLPWSDAKNTPHYARFTQENSILEVNVLDLRPSEEFEKTPLPEIDLDPDAEQKLRDSFLLQRYGGLDAEESLASRSGNPKSQGSAAQPADYSVMAWTVARKGFGIVDAWRNVLTDAENDPISYQSVYADGRALQAYFARSSEPADRLVAEELEWRLNLKEKT